MAPATVVMLGDVGMGKSTIVEKVVGMTGLSSNADESFTKTSAIGESPCKRLQIIDTPGGNSMESKLEHNIWIAHALNFAPVSSILLTVKAETRIDNTVSMVRAYAERFQDAAELLTVCVTHMDTVQWSNARFCTCLEKELGLDSAIFVGKDTTSASIITNILERCKSPQPFMINSTNFLKLFKINDNKLKILKSVNDEVSGFRMMKQVFETYLRSLCTEQEKVDLVFEFQAYMMNQIVEAQKRVSAQNNFTFMGDTACVANEAGHIANLTNQLRAILYDVRTMALAYQNDAGVSALRKCPHCGLVWAKITGCNGTTTCGNREDQPESRWDVMSAFTFQFDGKQLLISKGGNRNRSRNSGGTGSGVGCGKSITWSTMAPVQIPEEFRVKTAASTEDIGVIPTRHKRTFDQAYQCVESSMAPIRKISRTAAR